MCLCIWIYQRWLFLTIHYKLQSYAIINWCLRYICGWQTGYFVCCLVKGTGIMYNFMLKLHEKRHIMIPLSSPSNLKTISFADEQFWQLIHCPHCWVSVAELCIPLPIICIAWCLLIVHRDFSSGFGIRLVVTMCCPSLCSNTKTVVYCKRQCRWWDSALALLVLRPKNRPTSF